MNTKLTVVSSYKSKDNLLILAENDKFDWFGTYLNDFEIKFVKRAIKNDVPHILLPRENNAIIIQFLKEGGNDFESKEEARIAGNEILSVLAHYKIGEITIINHCFNNKSFQYLEGMALGNYQFLKYFNDKAERCNSLKSIKISNTAISKAEAMELRSVISAVCKARDLVNEPQSYLSAVMLSEEIKKIAKESGFTVKVFDKKKIQAMKMGGLLAVNMGSMTPPRFNILEWKPKGAKNKNPFVIIGKGIVYDTGGLSLKSTPNSMDMMKSDMAGAATVVGSIAAIAKANIPVHIIALVPSTDNRPGNQAYVPGDVITMYSGSTVEVMNTDAEGRLILADALHYAKKLKPKLVMDFATLTGSAVRACGPEAICFMGNTGKETKLKLEESGNKVYERLIEFPLWKEYGEQLKSNIADLKNLGGSSAGMITAGKFLEHFTDYPWLHFDIAGPAYLQKSDSYRPKEGTGVGVRLLFDFFKNYYS